MEVALVPAHKDRGGPHEAGGVSGMVVRHREALSTRRCVSHAVRIVAFQHVGSSGQKLRRPGDIPDRAREPRCKGEVIRRTPGLMVHEPRHFMLLGLDVLGWNFACMPIYLLQANPIIPWGEGTWRRRDCVQAARSTRPEGPYARKTSCSSYFETFMSSITIRMQLRWLLS